VECYFSVKYKFFLDSQTKLNYSNRSWFHKSRKTELDWGERVICAACRTDQGKGWSRLANHVLLSHFVTTSRERSIQWHYIIDHERSKHWTPRFTNFETTIFLLFLIMFAVSVTYRFWSAVCFLCSWHLQPK
jgi:hypothetical protein